MAVRIVALLIPLAITLPQLQMSRRGSAAEEPAAAQVQPAPAPEWSYDTRRGADAALTRVALESPLQNAVHAIGSAPSDAAPRAPVQPAARKAPPQRAAAKPARLASPANKAGTPPNASLRHGTRHAKAPPPDAGCEPFAAHCAPVVMGKVTPVSRKSL
jgi:hypothetical protein